MIFSMTGFGKAKREDENWRIDCEVKTVNNRYLDLRIKSPALVSSLDNDIQELAKKYFQRGRVEIIIAIQALQSVKSIRFDGDLFKEVLDEFHALKEKTSFTGNFSFDHFLQMEGAVIYEKDDLDEEALWLLMENVLEEAFGQVNDLREKEGAKLGTDLLEKLIDMTALLRQIEDRGRDLVKSEHERLTDKVNALLEGKVELDEAVLATEIAVLAQKLDTDEEVVRLKSHIGAFEDTLKTDKPMGKTLDFMIQEMNREVNTIGSKSNDFDIRKTCVDLKSIIEQMREQVQNIE